MTPLHSVHAANPREIDPRWILAAQCLALSLSLDGLTWSAPRPLVRCAAAGERAVHHPAAGLVRRGRHVLFYVHEDVSAIRLDAKTPEVRPLRSTQ